MYGFDVEWDGSDGRALQVRRRAAAPNERKGMHISIKLSDAALNDPCAICGGRNDHEPGPEPFLDGTWDPVCWRCADECAPELVQCLLDHWQASGKRGEAAS